MFNYVMMRCLVQQQENEQLPVQKAFHKHASRVHNSCKKSPEGILLQCAGCACVRACAMGRKREWGAGRGPVKIISGFSVRMNFTTVSSHEII